MSEAEPDSKSTQTKITTGAIAVEAGGNVNIAGRDVIIQYARDEFVELQTALRVALADRREKQARSLLASNQPPEQPYRYLDYFDLEQRGVFFGRRAAQAALLDKIDQGRLTLLHAPSGAGKTSLLRAGAQAALIEDGHLPVYLPRPARALQAIRQFILPTPPYPERFAQWPLSTLLAWTCQYLGDKQIKLVILIDQFEEFFIHASPGEQGDFVRNLAECLEHSDLERVRFVIAMRKDYFSDMALFEPFIPQVFQNTYRLPTLTHAEARLAVEAPLVGRLIQWEAGAVAVLLAYLEQGEIETPHLQLICSRLYDRAVESGQSEIQVKDLDLESIHAQYLEEEMAALAPPAFTAAQKDLAWKLLKRLVTSSGTRQPLSLEALDELAPPEEINPVLKRLVDRRLLRRDDEHLDGRVIIEVAHDTLAKKIQAYELPEEIRCKATRELIDRGLEDWQRHQALLDLPRLSILDEYQDVMPSLFKDQGLSSTWKQAALEFLLRSALKHAHQVTFWFDLARENGVEAEKIVLEGLKDETFRVRAASVAALGKLGAQFMPNLCEMLLDDYPQVRMAAMAALERLQPSGEWRKHLKFECYVPAGEFIMGDDQGDKDEKPAHPVYLEAFYIAKYPVTNREYARYRQDLNQPFELPAGKENHPVVEVSWYEARDYAAWAGMSLLTEAEWEKAASWQPANLRGSGQKRIYPWGNEYDPKKCNTFEAGIGTTTPVGQFSPQGDSPYGVADMAGNVWEWCSSEYKDYPYQKEDGREEMTGGEWRVQRGGSFDNVASYARCASRHGDDPNFRLDHYGFRVGVGVPAAPGTLPAGNAVRRLRCSGRFTAEE